MKCIGNLTRAARWAKDTAGLVVDCLVVAVLCPRWAEKIVRADERVPYERDEDFARRMTATYGPGGYVSRLLEKRREQN